MELSSSDVFQNSNDFRVSFDVFCDFVPFVSTISMMIGLAQKYLYVSEMEADQTLDGNRYYTHLKNKDFQFSLLYIPFANFFFAIKLHCCSNTDENVITPVEEEKLSTAVKENHANDNAEDLSESDEATGSLQTSTQPEEEKVAEPPMKETTTSTPSVIEAKETKAEASINEILPRVLSCFYANDEKKGIVKECEKNAGHFNSFSNDYLLNKTISDGAIGKVRIDDLQFKLPIDPLALTDLAFYFVLTGEYKGLKLEKGHGLSNLVVCLKTKISSSDTGFYTKELLLQIVEDLSKFPPVENFPIQNYHIKYAYSKMKQAYFEYLANKSFGTAEAGLRCNTRYDLHVLGEANLKFLVDSNVIKTWENSSSGVILILD